jgi:hypothetical protein
VSVTAVVHRAQRPEWVNSSGTDHVIVASGVTPAPESAGGVGEARVETYNLDQTEPAEKRPCSIATTLQVSLAQRRFGHRSDGLAHYRAWHST